MAKNNIHYDVLKALEIHQEDCENPSFLIKLVPNVRKKKHSYSFWYEEYGLFSGGLSPKRFKTRKAAVKQALVLASVALSKGNSNSIKIQNYGSSKLDFGWQ